MKAIMIDPTMDITMDELNLILGGLSDDGQISKEAEEQKVKTSREGVWGI